MNEILLTIFAGQVIMAPIYYALWRKRKNAETAQAAEDCTDAWASIQAVEALKRAYKSLKEQKGAGYGPWISACLQRAQGGQVVEPSAALMAIRWTIHELEWSRFNLTGLKRAENELEVLAG